jgi:hypothetical protein
MKKNRALGVITLATIFCAPLFAGQIKVHNESPERIQVAYGSWCGVQPFTKTYKGPATFVEPSKTLQRNHPLCEFYELSITDENGKTIFYNRGNSQNINCTVRFDNETGKLKASCNLG